MKLIDADALFESINNIEHIDLVGFNYEFIKDIITNAPTVQREGWVSVEDRLPEFMLYAGEPLKVNGRDIPPLFRSERIMYVAEGVIFVGKLEKLNSTIIPSGVTHWQPLPTPPKLK